MNTHEPYLTYIHREESHVMQPDFLAENVRRLALLDAARTERALLEGGDRIEVEAPSGILVVGQFEPEPSRSGPHMMGPCGVPGRSFPCWIALGFRVPATASWSGTEPSSSLAWRFWSGTQPFASVC